MHLQYLLAAVLLNAAWDVVSWACLTQTDAPEGSPAHAIAELHAGMWLAGESRAARATLGWLVLALGVTRLAFVAEPSCRTAVISTYFVEMLWVLAEVHARRMAWGAKTVFTVFSCLLMWMLLLLL